MTSKTYLCSKCNDNQYSTTQIRTTGSGLSRFLNLQNQKFSAVSCKSCGFTELYKTGRSGLIGDILDIMTN